MGIQEVIKKSLVLQHYFPVCSLSWDFHWSTSFSFSSTTVISISFPSPVYITDKKKITLFFSKALCSLRLRPLKSFPYLFQDRFKAQAKDLPTLKIPGIMCLSSAWKATHKTQVHHSLPNNKTHILVRSLVEIIDHSLLNSQFSAI